jgi:hypothetical protein
MKMVSAFVFILTVVLSVTSVVFTVFIFTAVFCFAPTVFTDDEKDFLPIPLHCIHTDIHERAG